MMVGIDVEQQRVLDALLVGRTATSCVEMQHCIFSIHMVVHQQPRKSQWALFFRRSDLQMSYCEPGDGILPCPQLAPRDLAIAVTVHADGMLEIAQGDVPLN